ncbi:MAG: hypothetical protein L0G48_04770 [Staphylococcus equorum]|nr:hypothetical protein [Staphylococcus equorum]MDN5696246.1 hypothetical protein [Staphylococcus equorum]
MGIKVSKGLVSTLVIAVSLLGATTGAFAITDADVTGATGASGGESAVAAGFKYLLTFVVGLYVGRKIVGMFGRG